MRLLRTYRALQLISRHGSIRKAADYLAISPSALNRAVQTFESELGAPVFERLTAGVRLSTEGELLMPVIEAHLTQFDEFQKEISDLQGGLSGSVRLSLAADLATGLVPEVLGAYRAEYPRIDISVLLANDAGLLANRGAELAIVSNPVTDQTTEAVMSHASPLVAVPGGDVTFASATVKPWQLVEHPLIVPPEETGTRTALEHLFRRNRLSPKGMASLPGGLAAPGASDVQVLPKIAVPEITTAVTLEGASPVQVVVLRRADGLLSRAAQHLLTRLQAAFDGRSPGGD